MSVVSVAESRPFAERYRASFAARWPADDALTTLKREALERFLASGFPTPRHEDWKYTNLRRLEARTFAPAERAAVALDARQQRWLENSGIRAVLVNGYLMPALGTTCAQPPGVTLLGLRSWLEHDAAQVASLLAQPAAAATAPLEQLNTALFEDGVLLNIGEGVALDEPVYVVHQWSDTGRPQMSHPRVLVRAGRGSRCTLIEHFIGPAGAEYFTNAVAGIELAEGATLEHYRVQQESPRSFHIGQVNARLERDARYLAHDIALGASLGRTNLAVSLAGAGAHTQLHGLLTPSAAQHLDAHTVIEHAAPHTSSEENYRAIAADRGRGVFNGKIIVRPGAQQTDARQSSRNLLLSAGAEIDARPQLEIYANDVKCSHGAATGQLDAAALFYLRSRGLSQSEARAALIRAFAASILSSIKPAPLRSHLEQLLDDRYAS